MAAPGWRPNVNGGWEVKRVCGSVHDTSCNNPANSTTNDHSSLQYMPLYNPMAFSHANQCMHGNVKDSWCCGVVGWPGCWHLLLGGASGTLLGPYGPDEDGPVSLHHHKRTIRGRMWARTPGPQHLSFQITVSSYLKIWQHFSFVVTTYERGVYGSRL